MSNELSGVTNRSIRDGLGDRCFNKAGLVIDETNSENPKITAAVEHTVNGVFQTAYAVAAQIDLSAIAVINAKDGSVLSAAGAASAVVTMPAVAAGGDSVTKTYILACKGDVAYIIEPEIDTAGTDDADFPLTCPAGYAPFGLIKIVQAAGAALFKFGTTAMTGVANQTVTFFDVSAVPPTVASITTV